MRKVLGLVVLLAIAPLGARADGSETLRAPYAYEAEITQCQWIAAIAGIGTCTMSSEPHHGDGSVFVDAQIASPDSPAGAHTAPTWGQAIAQGMVYAGYTLEQPADSVTFTFTWHLASMHFVADGPPVLAWNNAVAQATVDEVPCACERAGVSVTLSPTSIGNDVTATISLHAQRSSTQNPLTPPSEYRPIPPGTFVIKAGFEVQSGLIATPGLTRTTAQGSVSQITVNEVDAPPPPAQR